MMAQLNQVIFLAALFLFLFDFEWHIQKATYAFPSTEWTERVFLNLPCYLQFEAVLLEILENCVIASSVIILQHVLNFFCKTGMIIVNNTADIEK